MLFNLLVSWTILDILMALPLNDVIVVLPLWLAIITFTSLTYIPYLLNGKFDPSSTSASCGSDPQALASHLALEYA